MILIVFLVSEAAIRTWFCLQYNTPFFRPKEIFLNYYPELKTVLKNDAKDAGFRILVLGGSVVYDDTVKVEIDGNPHYSTFCNLPNLIKQELHQDAPNIDVDIISLAQPAHNSLDSWYKYKLLEKQTFDLVIVYHGINDTRTNNCKAEVFDINYRHVSFYNDLFVIFRHPEINISVLPYFFDIAIQRLLVHTGIKTTIPRDYSIFYKSQAFDGLFTYGASIKSEASFKRNLDNIIRLAQKKHETVVLSTYAFYLAENYTLNRFIDRKLDYAEQIYPVELYGSPENVVKGIKAHNAIIKGLHKNHPKTLFVDQDSIIPKDGKHFNDICHLTDDGCEIMAEEFTKLIKPRIR